MADIPDEIEEERIYTIAIGATRGGLRNKRARFAMDTIRNHVSRHMKIKTDKVWVDPRVNEAVWSKGGKSNMPKLKVKAVKIKDYGLVEVTLHKE